MAKASTPTTTPLKKLVIDRKTWLRGEGDTRSLLLRSSDGKMCCMGSWALQNGRTPEQIVGKVNLTGAGFLKEDFNIHVDGGFMSIYAINDNFLISDAERERLLTAAFLANGVEVEFIN